MKKSILSLGTLGLISLTLASCGKTYTYSTPYGTLTDNTVYASNGDAKIGQKTLYSMMRAEGYSEVKENLKNQLFSDILPKYSDGKLTNTTYFDYNPDSEDEDVLNDTYTINASIIASMYGVSSVDDFKELTAKAKETSLKKYVDTLFTSGVRKDDGSLFTYADLSGYAISFKVDKNGKDVFYANFPYALYKSYIYQKAMENYALEQLKNPDFKYYYKNKYISGVGTNSYYVEDKDITDYYYSTGKNYIDYSGIIIKFNSYASAQRIIESAIGKTTISDDPTTALDEYIKIYNLRYSTRDKLSVDSLDTDRYVNLSVAYNSDRLSDYDTTIKEIFKEKMENGDYLTSIFNSSTSYYLVYRLTGSDVVEWANLPEAEKTAGTADKETVYDKMLDCLLKNKSLSSLVTKIENERFDELFDNDALEIYDPVYLYRFESENDDYDMKKISSNDYIYKFTYNNNEYSLTPSELYEKLEPKYGVSNAMQYLKNEWLLSLNGVSALINNDDFDDIKDNLNSEIKSFKKGKKSYPSKLGTQTYLQLVYGFDTKEEVIKNKNAELINSKLSTFYGDFTSATDSEKFNSDATLFKNFASIYQKLYESYFKASISHILIGLDVNGDSSYKNPDTYYESLPTDALKQKFNETLLNLVNAIISEVKILTTSKSVKDSLTYIVEAYNNNYLIGSLSEQEGHEVYWNDLKNEFPFALKAEDLSTIDLFSAANYMEEFSDRVKKLFDDVKDDIIDETKVDEDGVFEFDTTFATADDMYNALCKTSYGYHILNIYDIDEASSAMFKSTSDSKVNDDDTYKQYEHLKVIILADDQDGDEDDDDDPEYVLYTDGYSDNDYASVNQLFVYFYESVVTGTHTLLKSSTKSAISTMFDSALTFFTNSTFREWMILKYQMTGLTFSKEGYKDAYMANKENNLYSYSTSKYTLFTDYIDGTYNWTIDYSWNH